MASAIIDSSSSFCQSLARVNGHGQRIYRMSHIIVDDQCRVALGNCEMKVKQLGLASASSPKTTMSGFGAPYIVAHCSAHTTSMDKRGHRRIMIRKDE